MKNETPNHRAIKRSSRLVFVGGGGGGGTGKTTLSVALADYYRSRGIPVVLIDAETEPKPKGRLRCYYPEAEELDIHTNSSLNKAGSPAVNERKLTLVDLGAGAGPRVLEWLRKTLIAFRRQNVPITLICPVTESLHSIHIDLPAFSGAPLNQVTKFLLDDATAKAGYLERRVTVGTMDLPPSTKITSPARSNISIWDALQTIADANKLRFDVDGSWPGGITLYPPRDEDIIHPPTAKAGGSVPTTTNITSTQPFIAYDSYTHSVIVKGDKSNHAAIYQAYITREVARLKSYLNLTPQQETMVKATMEEVAQAGSTHTPITKTVDQALKEILDPQQEKAWEELKEDAPKVQAESIAISETNVAVRLLHLNDAQKDKTLSALEQIESDSQIKIKSVHSPAELSDYLDGRVQAQEMAMSNILTADQFATYTQYLLNDLHVQKVTQNLIPVQMPPLQFAPARATMTSSLDDQESLKYSLNR